MPCLTEAQLFPPIFDSICIDWNITSSNTGFLDAAEACCFGITSSHLVISNDGCYAYCNVSTKYEGIAVGTCGNNIDINFPNARADGISGSCSYATLAPGDDIRTRIPRTLLGPYATPTDGGSGTVTSTQGAGGASSTDAGADIFTIQTSMPESTAASSTQSATGIFALKTSTPESTVASSTALSSTLILSLTTSSAPASTTSVSKSRTLHIPKAVLGSSALMFCALWL